MSWRLNVRSCLAVLGALAWCAAAAAGQAPWSIPPDVLADIDLRRPHVAGPADMLHYWAAARDLAAIEHLIARGQLNGVPSYYRAWAYSQLDWWERMGRWLYGQTQPQYEAGVVFCGQAAQGDAKQLIVQAARDVADFLSSRFDLPRPHYAVFVHIFADWNSLPRDIASAFGQHEGLVSVSGLTLPPRFVIIPTALRAHHFWGRPEPLIAPDGRVVSLLTLRDIVYHEMVHGLVLGLIDERAEKAAAGPAVPGPDDLPQWFHEGLAVYVTEKLKIEPGTKPVSYYRFAAPLHYLEDEWGEETLRDFVRTAVTRGFSAAMAQIPMSEQRLLELGDEHLHRPAPIGSIARSFGYVLAFLLGLLGLALAPAAIGWAWRAVRAAVVPPSEQALEAMWAEAWYGLTDNRRGAIARFLRAYRRATAEARNKFAWRRCKIFLVAGE